MSFTETKIGITSPIFLFPSWSRCGVTSPVNSLCSRRGRGVRRWSPWRTTGGWTGCGWPVFSPGPGGCRSPGCPGGRRTAAAWTAPARSGSPCSSGSSPRCRRTGPGRRGTAQEEERRWVSLKNTFFLCTTVNVWLCWHLGVVVDLHTRFCVDVLGADHLTVPLQRLQLEELGCR